jgi:hypothetical protein
MSSLFQRAPRLSSLAVIVLGIILTGCYTKLGTVASSESSPEQPVTDASAIAEAPTSSDGTDRTQSASTSARDDVDDFFQDFDHYALKYLDASDRALVREATRLLKERADAEISLSAYRDRLNNFRTEHPDFYGNFFGDPFYATYDLRYTRLAELRQRINIFINPQNSIRNTVSFYCNPLTYDPAFNGQCRGFTFAASDFFLLPSGPGFGQQDLPSARGHDWMLTARRDIGTRPRSVDLASRVPDTSRISGGGAPTPDRPTPDPSTSGAAKTAALDASPPETPTQTPSRLVSEIEVPDAVHTRMQETASSLERTETLLRIRQEIRRRSERGQLSYRERARVAQQIAEDRGVDELTRSISRVRRTLTDHADRGSAERLDRTEIERRTRRRTDNRSAEPNTSESVQRRTETPESSESDRNRSRSSENSSNGG